MSITITEVKRIREFSYSSGDQSGTAVYDVHFETETLAEYSDYITKLNMCFTAEDPNTDPLDDNTKVPAIRSRLKKGEIVFPAYVSNVTPRVHQGQNDWWRVTVEYSSITQGDGEDDDEVFDENPFDMPAQFSWGQGQIQKVMYFDKTAVADGGPLAIVASSGEGFTQLPTMTETYITCTVNRNTASYDPIAVLDYVDHVNNAQVTLDGHIFPIGQVLLKSWTATKRTVTVALEDEDEPTIVTFFEEVREYHINKNGWLGEIFDQGVQHIVANKRVPMTIQGQLVRNPQPLNGLGLRIFDDKGAVVNTPVDQLVIGLNNRPGVKAVVIDAAGTKIAVLLFNFYAKADLTDLGDDA